MITVVKPDAWLTDLQGFHGEWQGSPHGANMCVIANRIDGPGGGPRLHQHPYAEVFVIREGTALFTVDGATFEAGRGEIVVCPANTPHKFTNLGPGALETIDIHESGTFDTEWLE